MGFKDKRVFDAISCNDLDNVVCSVQKKYVLLSLLLLSKSFYFWTWRLCSIEQRIFISVSNLTF